MAGQIDLMINDKVNLEQNKPLAFRAGIVNFAPITIKLSERVSLVSVGLVGVGLAIELEQIAFAVVNRRDVR
ncbi:MAG: hypothetical protein VX988_04400 [Planctomycetota bacterium]|nr:hypothetical protein [Planctomycetota bacterium]